MNNKNWGLEIQVCYTVEWCGCGGGTDYKSLELNRHDLT